MLRCNGGRIEDQTEVTAEVLRSQADRPRIEDEHVAVEQGKPKEKTKKDKKDKKDKSKSKKKRSEVLSVNEDGEEERKGEPDEEVTADAEQSTSTKKRKKQKDTELRADAAEEKTGKTRRKKQKKGI